MPSAVAVASASDLRTGSDVISTVAMKGVPEGTRGKVIHVQGLSWTRYWVRFDNGLRVGTVARSKLATPQEWERRHDAPVATTGVVVAAAESADDAQSVGGVPAHLLERSRKARERLAAKG